MCGSTGILPLLSIRFSFIYDFIKCAKKVVTPMTDTEKEVMTSGTPLAERLQSEMKEALRSGDQIRLSVIRLLRSSIKYREIEKGKDKPLTDEEFLQVIGSAVKQRRESIEQFTKGNRHDLVAKEQQELDILKTYLPQPLSQEELLGKINAAISTAGANDLKQMGKVMKILMPQVVGRAEGTQVSQIVRSLLEQKS